jgi:hypothetical protein
LKNILIKFINLENYSLEDFYNDIGEYILQLNNIVGVHYLGLYFYKSLFIGDSIAFKLIYYNSIPILYEQIHVKAGKNEDNKLILLLSPFYQACGPGGIDWCFNIFIFDVRQSILVLFL